MWCQLRVRAEDHCCPRKPGHVGPTPSCRLGQAPCSEKPSAVVWPVSTAPKRPSPFHSLFHLLLFSPLKKNSSAAFMPHRPLQPLGPILSLFASLHSLAVSFSLVVSQSSLTACSLPTCFSPGLRDFPCLTYYPFSRRFLCVSLCLFPLSLF